MGCSSSKEVGDAPPPKRVPVQRPVEETTWKTDESWANLYEKFNQWLAQQEDGRALALVNRQPDMVFDSVKSWLNDQHRISARRKGFTEFDWGLLAVEGEDDNMQPWPCKTMFVMDPCSTGLAIAVVLVIAVPVEEAKPWLAPGDMVKSNAVQAAINRLTSNLTEMEKTSANSFDMAELLIFAGADLVRARWRPSITEPIITPLHRDLDKSELEGMRSLSKTASKLPQPMAVLQPRFLHDLLVLLESFAPEVSLWDEGELPFAVEDSSYPYATRLLVTRDDKVRDEEVEAQELKLTAAEENPLNDHPPHFLWRTTDPDKDPGGILMFTLAIADAPHAPAPNVGDYVKGPVMKAAAAALLELVKDWHRQGKVQHCLCMVSMGFDVLRFSFIGGKLDPSAKEARASKVPVPRRGEKDMDAFFVKLEEQPKHSLFASEEQFQGVKAKMTERMAADPDKHKGLMMEHTRMSAMLFLSMNFPETGVCFEGGLPLTYNGHAVETILAVGKLPDKTQKHIKAVIYGIPSPDGDLAFGATGQKKVWLGTDVHKTAVATLLTKMQQWQAAGKIAEGECMAQVMIGVDVDVLLFVDGRFEDPSQERMAQIQWG